MVNGNHLMFGYGDIGVRAESASQRIRFWQIKPPANCGDHLDNGDIDFIGEPVYLHLEDLDEQFQFIDLLSEVPFNRLSFEFKGLIFDFTKYNSNSVHVCKEKAKIAMSLYTLALAC